MEDLPTSGEVKAADKEKSMKLQASSKNSLQPPPVLLHGTLNVTIHEATNLPNMDAIHEQMRKCFTLFDPCTKPCRKVDVVGHSHSKKRITSDPYVSVILGDVTIARTRVISNEQDPQWEEHFSIPVAHSVDSIDLVVKDNDLFGAEFAGEAKLPAADFLLKPEEPTTERWLDLLTKDGKPCHPGAQLKVSIKFTPVETDSRYKDGVGKAPDFIGVPDSYFGLRKGCQVTLYQDADMHADHNFPDIMLDGGIQYKQKCCWEEICTAILEAHHLIYIAGWSIHTKTSLLRRQNNAMPEVAFKNLGELLKYKSRELVRVLLLVWDDKTSHTMLNNVGVMGTHDEETRSFFKHSSVQCTLAPRYADSKLSWFKQKVVGTLYTHHQKLVIVDSQGPGNFRKLTAFIGGLDLCDGRYDTPQHLLFRSLPTTFENDYHNPTFATNADAGGPRQPWHDLHCKIEGPAAYDVLTNFEQRWRKALRLKLRRNFRKAIKQKEDHLANLDNISWIFSWKKKTKKRTSRVSRTDDDDDYDIDTDDDEHLRVTQENDPETWHTQVFRSIDSGSVKGFPKDVTGAGKKHLVCGKNVTIDTSIHNAYVKAIRSAQHFIYIENQYFLGSSFAWPDYRKAGANHLIPIELALKVASKIKAKEHFAVYVVIPMWPEGVPTDNAMQEILYFQGQTMEMMYKIIANAIKEANWADEYQPTDFLNFFCLGNREVKDADEPESTVKPIENSLQAIVQKTRRFMIYVHAKGMIVDDEFAILGSANINQRSMDGSRDTEIAMGAYQPHYSWAHKKSHPKGQVYGYRTSLWCEHMGRFEECFAEPWTVECVRRVRSISQEYWKQYTAEQVTEMEGHLLPYPIQVEADGKVVSLPDFDAFPDVGGRVLGNSAIALPDTLTT